MVEYWSRKALKVFNINTTGRPEFRILRLIKKRKTILLFLDWVQQNIKLPMVFGPTKNSRIWSEA